MTLTLQSAARMARGSRVKSDTLVADSLCFKVITTFIFFFKDDLNKKKHKDNFEKKEMNKKDSAAKLETQWAPWAKCPSYHHLDGLGEDDLSLSPIAPWRHHWPPPAAQNTRLRNWLSHGLGNTMPTAAVSWSQTDLFLMEERASVPFTRQGISTRRATKG